MTLCMELNDYGGLVSKLSQSAIDFYKTRCCRMERETETETETDRQTDRQTNRERQRSSWVKIAVLGQTQL